MKSHRGTHVGTIIFLTILLSGALLPAGTDSDAPDVSGIFSDPAPAREKTESKASNSDEPDPSSIFGEPAGEKADSDGDAPDAGSIFGEPESGGEEPDIGSVFGDTETSEEPATSDIFGVEEREKELVAGVEAEGPKDYGPAGQKPESILGEVYYYLDYGPKYIQYYLQHMPNQAAGYIEKKTGLPLQTEQYPFELSGFVESRAGLRWQKDPHEKAMSIAEHRLQIEAHKTFEWHLFDGIKSITWSTTTFNYRGDIVGDYVTEEVDFDLREANVQFSPFPWADVKIGRQILTWGTGDMLFINDLFPKDWQSFFIGRDVEYLKAPSDALKVSMFTHIMNADFVWVPLFNPDRYITGERLSYWNPLTGQLEGRNLQLSTDEPNRWFRDMEWHARLYRNLTLFDKTYQIAGYYYNGFWKSPGGFNPENNHAIFPRLQVWGGSARGPVWKGIGNVEVGYYDSTQDAHGKNPFINNDEFRFMLGYEQNMEDIFKTIAGQKYGTMIGRDLTFGTQYYSEWMMNYGRYRNTLPPGIDPRDEVRQLVTFRVTKLLMDQNLELSLFTYFSPSDVDVYMRPQVSYKLTDYWTVDAGANLFFGQETHTFFNQFDKNSNVYMGLRFSF